MFAPYARLLAERAAAWAPARVLEIAAGSGISTRALVEALPDARITATDLNASMVAWARQHVPEPTWSVADAQDLTFAPGSFDLVVCEFGAMFFPDRPAAFRQVRGVLAPAGRALLSIWDDVSGSDLPAALVACLREVLPPGPPPFIERVPYGYHDPDRITTDLRAGGFEDVEVERVVLHGAPTDPALLVEGICLGTPLRFELEQHGDLIALTGRLQDLMAARVGTDPVAGALAAYVVTAV